MTQHTPGPWGVIEGPLSDYEDGGLIIEAEKANRDIAYTNHDGRHFWGGVGLRGKYASAEEEANAHLIASAPELLEAVYALLGAGNNWKEYHEAANKARAVIARATEFDRPWPAHLDIEASRKAMAWWASRAELGRYIEPQHSPECALKCEHCHHGSDCYKTCCWCGGVRDGEGNVSLEFVECDCEVGNG